ncbi:MAG: hypothetical protein EBR88_04430 [Betaproteobacteria bacterium]|nr:hypothetical protein [Betaproteobacteria bacterium]
MHADDHSLSVLMENFGSLEAHEMAEFLGEVIEQLSADLQAICSSSSTDVRAALHRIAGSAPSVGCLTLGTLARAEMSTDEGANPHIVSAAHAALTWLKNIREETVQ